MKPLFIFGAGFSKWISPEMPLMNDLINSIPNDLREKIKNANLNGILEHNDLEYLVSYLHTRYPWKTDSENHLNLSLYYEIIDHITKSITSGTQKAESNLDNLRIEKLVNFWKKSPTWLITFNYDILIEKMLKKYYSHDNWYNYWNLPLIDISDRSNSDTGMIWGSPGETSRRPEIILSKLHGSINWYRSKHNPSANEPIYYDGNQSYNNHIRTNMKGLKPFIIPPSIEKSSFLNHDILNVIWELAKNQLSGDSKLYIIGYSFPVTDVYINLLFDICMNKSKEIIIVNSDNSDTFKNRMNEYFRKYGIVPDLKYVKKENAINDFIDEIN